MTIEEHTQDLESELAATKRRSRRALVGVSLIAVCCLVIAVTHMPKRKVGTQTGPVSSSTTLILCMNQQLSLPNTFPQDHGFGRDFIVEYIPEGKISVGLDDSEIWSATFELFQGFTSHDGRKVFNNEAATWLYDISPGQHVLTAHMNIKWRAGPPGVPPVVDWAHSEVNARQTFGIAMGQTNIYQFKSSGGFLQLEKESDATKGTGAEWEKLEETVTKELKRNGYPKHSE